MHCQARIQRQSGLAHRTISVPSGHVAVAVHWAAAASDDDGRTAKHRASHDFFPRILPTILYEATSSHPLKMALGHIARFEQQ